MIDVSNITEIAVPFYDVDVMQIVWHGHYVKYMEQARCQLLDLIDYNYPAMRDSGYAWPVVDLRIKYVKPLAFQQVILIHTTITEIEYGLNIKFEFFDKLSNQKLTKAHTKQVAVSIESGEMCLLSPDILQQKINAYLKHQ